MKVHRYLMDIGIHMPEWRDDKNNQCERVGDGGGGIGGRKQRAQEAGEEKEKKIG